MSAHDDEFYIGYERDIPRGIATCVRRAVVAAAVATVAIAASLTLAQRPLAEASFDYGRQQSWVGWLERAPAPALVIPLEEGERRVWLVGRGKHGADRALAGVAEGWVRVTGTEIARDPWRMVELASATAEVPPPGALRVRPPRGDAPARPVVLTGEIVDSKCFLGVMNPGERTVHRDCAIRCMRGGIPPMLAYETGRRTDLAVLVDADGRLLHEQVHAHVGYAVRVEGELFTLNGQSVIQVTSIEGVAR